MKNKLILLFFYYFACGAQESNLNLINLSHENKAHVYQYLIYQVKALEAAMHKKALLEEQRDSNNSMINECSQLYFDNKAAAARLFGTLNTQTQELINKIMIHCVPPGSNLMCLQTLLMALEKLR